MIYYILVPSGCSSTSLPPSTRTTSWATSAFGRGDDSVGNPHRAQISQFELFELILLLKLDRQFSIERFETTVSQSTVPSPPPRRGRARGPRHLEPRARAPLRPRAQIYIYIYIYIYKNKDICMYIYIYIYVS